MYDNRWPEFAKTWLISKKFKDYRPQAVSVSNIKKWLKQFEDPEERKTVLDLLFTMEFFSEKRTRDLLLKQNERVLEQLGEAGISPKNIIYVTLSDPGSSSHVMLNLLRNAANLERKGCSFIDHRDTLKLSKKIAKLGKGAIIYVDDFAGTGNQFHVARNFISSTVPLLETFSEFLILPSVCEEAYSKIDNLGVAVRYGHMHDISERPLHPNNVVFDRAMMKKLRVYGEKVNSKWPLGYQGLATMVVFYHNAPNHIPIIFRGDLGQKNFVGVIPRTTDMPV